MGTSLRLESVNYQLSASQSVLLRLKYRVSGYQPNPDPRGIADSSSTLYQAFLGLLDAETKRLETIAAGCLRVRQ